MLRNICTCLAGCNQQTQDPSPEHKAMPPRHVVAQMSTSCAWVLVTLLAGSALLPRPTSCKEHDIECPLPLYKLVFMCMNCLQKHTRTIKHVSTNANIATSINESSTTWFPTRKHLIVEGSNSFIKFHQVSPSFTRVSPQEMCVLPCVLHSFTKSFTRVSPPCKNTKIC